ncbi:MAG: hypothetical protein AABY15_00975, partial [Nanoarchaeota archaeon]
MLTDFGEQFAAKVLRRFYANSVTSAITNRQYEGEIKKMGDRVNILSFPGDMPTGDYVTGTDMTLFPFFDLEEQLVVEKRKYYNFQIDRLEDLFTYVDDAESALLQSSSEALIRGVDEYTLAKAGDVKAGHWVGIDLRIAGSSSDTHASIATTATGGTLTIQGAPTAGNTVGGAEIGDGTLVYYGFKDPEDIGKPIRLTSGSTWATEWYRISAVTDSDTASIVNWDGAVDAMDIPTGDILRGLYGAQEFAGAGTINGDDKPTTANASAGWGWEFQAARATVVTSSLIYEQLVELKTKLDESEIPSGDRHVTGPSKFVNMLNKAGELQADIQMAYEGVILNGRVGRASGFEIHEAAGIRTSTRLEKSTAAGVGASTVLTD